MKQTFVHRFIGGATCTVVLNKTRIFNGKSPIVACEWSEKPEADVIPEYREWMLGLLQILVDQTGKSIIHVLQVSKHEWEPWVLRANVRPELARL